MGIGVTELNFLKFCNVPLGRVLTVGRQEIHLPRSFGLQGYCENLLIQLGATSVISLDFTNYEGSTLEIDLSEKINKLPNNKFDTILDFGSLEHISNPIVAIENLINLLAPSGTIIHSTPANGSLGHGFYQFSPEFFQSAYSASGLVENIDTYLVNRKFPNTIFYVKPVTKGRRANIRFEKSNIYNLVRFKKIESDALIDGLNFQQLDYLGRYEKAYVPQIVKRVSLLTSIKCKLIDYINLRRSKLNKFNSNLIKIKLSRSVRP